MRYGFVIDQTRCIGCHACTVACKEENGVPLGVFRTWVKYVEKGEFPHTRRYFAVLRCNHCDHAPCVAICPTRALFSRADGIVDFDRDRCIGCKACMQACPYGALYLDPATRTAAKCHFCAHRVELGLEPSCVIVCPERAILAGDLDDPESEVARVVARQPVAVRKAEQGTRPKLFYVGADEAVLAPALHLGSAGTLWGERPGAAGPAPGSGAPGSGAAPAQTAAGAVRRAATPKPVEVLGRVAYDVPHEARPWGWRVWTYLWTKAVAAGAALAAGVGTLGGWPPARGLALPALALLFLLLTTALLIADLKRPARFHYLLLRPNPTSWLVWGAWTLVGFGAVTTLWLLAARGAPGLLPLLAVPLVALALAAAGYSAALFAQAEGRDAWQSPLVLPHLLLAAAVAGAAVARLVHGPSATLRGTLLAALGVHLLLLLADLSARHPTRDAALAARLVTGGPWRARFWGEVVLVGHLLPAGLLLASGGRLAVAASLLALWGLYRWEQTWVEAGQALPLS